MPWSSPKLGADYDRTREQIAGSPIEGGETAEDSPEVLPPKIADNRTGFEKFSDWISGKERKRDVAKAREKFALGQEAYDAAVALPQGTERKKKFRQAAKHFDAAADAWPNSDLEQQARFYQGESLIFCDEVPEAEKAFRDLVGSHPRTRFMSLVQARRFEIARYWLARGENIPSWEFVNLTDETRPWVGTRNSGMSLLDKMRFDDATGKLADDASMELARQSFLRGDYERADEVFADLRQAYPDSPHQFLAHLLGLRSKLETYQGPAYNGDVLHRAEDLLRQTERKFPNEVKQDEYRELIARANAEIRFRQAERLIYQGRYRQRKGENGAARFYYEDLLAKYSDTPLADEAKARLATIEGRPMLPPQRLAWLAEMFPEGDRAKPLVTANGETLMR
jgi:TolA-binding protein